MATPDSPQAPGAAARVSRLWRGLTFVAAAAALALALAASKYSSALRDERIRNSAQLAALRDRITSLEHDVVDAHAAAEALRQQADTSAKLTRAALMPDSRIIRLAPLKPAPNASAVIALSASGGQAMMRIAGLPPAPPGKTYELWWIGARGEPIKAALFGPDSHGAAIVAAAMPPAGKALAAGTVTLEPAAGSDQPAGAAYLKGAVRR